MCSIKILLGIFFYTFIFFIIQIMLVYFYIPLCVNRELMNKLQRIIDVDIEIEGKNFIMSARNMGIQIQAESMPEASSKLVEALNADYAEKGYWVDHDNIRMQFDVPQFFMHYRVLNAKFLAERIGMNAALLSHYVKGRKKPSKKQILKIVHGIHSIGKELTGLELR